MSMDINVKCPYCAFESTPDFDFNWSPEDMISLVQCPMEDGGCGEYYAVTFKVDIETTVFKLEEAKP